MDVKKFLEKKQELGYEVPDRVDDGFQTQPAENVSDSIEKDAEIQRLKELLLQERVKAAMAEAGVKPEKIARAARMVELEKIAVEGEIDPAALEAELAELLEEFPELKGGVPVQEKTGGFKIGSDGQQRQNVKQKIAEIFGNQ